MKSLPLIFFNTVGIGSISKSVIIEGRVRYLGAKTFPSIRAYHGNKNAYVGILIVDNFDRLDK